MASNGLKIELNAPLAERVKRAAAEAGVSVNELVASALEWWLDQSEAEQIAELDRRWAEHQIHGGFGQDQVAKWLDTWGTSSFRPWSKQ